MTEDEREIDWQEHRRLHGLDQDRDTDRRDSAIVFALAVMILLAVVWAIQTLS